MVVQRVAGTGYNYLGFNTKVGSLSDVRVRQAVSYLINRDAIVQRVLNGIGTPGIGPVSMALPWFNPPTCLATRTVLRRPRSCLRKQVMAPR